MLRWIQVFGNPLTWDDLPWLRSLTKLPLIVKGICHPDDARRAKDGGVDGIYCSTHGGRQANGGLPALDCLPGVVEAADGLPVLFDSGVRSGADVVKSLALGATKWQTIRQNVLPYALPGILTSSVLGVARVAGETAPILFTAAYALSDKLPWQISVSDDHLSPGFLGYLEYPFAWLRDFCLHPVNALPYHIYVVSSKIPQNEYTARVQYGTAFVFLAVVMVIAMASVVLRVRLRRSLKW